MKQLFIIVFSMTIVQAQPGPGVRIPPPQYTMPGSGSIISTSPVYRQPSTIQPAGINIPAGSMTPTFGR